MSITPQISVIMSTYNREQFLPRSIESILNQTFTNFEYIIVNNGSRDGTQQVCENYASRDSRIKLIQLPVNQGASPGKNAGLERVTGEYLTIIDDDDFCEPEMLEFLYESAVTHQADISICGSWFDYGGHLEPKYVFDSLYKLDKIQGLDELLKRELYNIAPPTKMFRSALFKNIRFKEHVLVDDIHVIYKAFAEAETVVAQGKPLYRFTKHGSNMTGFIQSNRLTPDILTDYLQAFRDRTEYLSSKVPGITARARYSEWSYMISMCKKIEEYRLSDCMEIYHRMRRTLSEHKDELLNSSFILDKEVDYLSLL